MYYAATHLNIKHTQLSLTSHKHAGTSVYKSTLRFMFLFLFKRNNHSSTSIPSNSNWKQHLIGQSMGIRGLEKFIRTSDHQIAKKIDIRHEIEKWRREHEKDPIIVIDIKEMNNVIEKLSDEGLTIGGRFARYNELLEYFFAEIKASNAELVFVAQLCNDKDINEYKTCFQDYDFISKNGGLTRRDRRAVNGKNQKMMGELRPNERFLYNLLHICAKYGEVKACYGMNKRIILTFVREKSEDILAVVTRDTEFFVYDVDFNYWSLSDVEFNHLKIDRVCRTTLKNVLDLNCNQMQLLQAISKLEMRIKLIDIEYKSGREWNKNFLGLVEYTKKQKCGPNGYKLSELTGRLTSKELEELGDEIAELKSINNYSGCHDDDIYNEVVSKLKNDTDFEAVLKFCKKNVHFAYKLINETTSGQKDLIFIDIRQSKCVKYVDLVHKITMKMIGIAFKDVETEKRPTTRSVQLKKHFNKDAVEIEMDIIYPNVPLPRLIELIIQEDDDSFDDSRWTALQWLMDVDAEKISEVKAWSGSKFLRMVSLTLKFLLSHDMISSVEADAIMRSEKQMETNNNNDVAPKSARPPPPPMPEIRYHGHVETVWVQAAHKYTIAFELISHCLELCGMRKETVPLKFDAFVFQANMHDVAKTKKRAQKSHS